MNRIFALFPGQGSQAVGMGKAFSDSSEIARELFAEADAALGFSLSKLCFEGPIEALTATDKAQPAILTASTIAYRLFRNHDSETPVVVAAGHSLGEYSALVAAEALTFADAVQLVHKRGRYMQEAVPQGHGKMVAILGKELAEVQAAIKKAGTDAQVANFNAPGQIVVSGSKQGVDTFLENFPGVKAKELVVSAPFHCSLMKPAEENLSRDLKAITFSEARFPVVSNYYAEPLTNPERIREALRLQVCGQVRWVDCVQVGREHFHPDTGVEFGTGKVISGLMKRIDRAFPCSSIGTPSEVEGGL
ncbi:MAG: ACP S-malonyltransferase [Bdellovibrionales bacterium]|nr:ACP S-malonyltransferase [Bdellovibrionales bacterium]